MDKKLPLFAFLCLLMTIACKKDETKAPFEAMDLTMPAVEFQMPTLPTSGSGWFQFKGVPLNLDSIIRARTANKFTQADVQSITVKNIDLELLNADTVNSLANFERLNVLLTITDAENLRLQGTKSFTEVFASSAALQPSSVNMKQAIDSLPFKAFLYVVSGNVRRQTLKPLDARINIVYHIE